MASLSGAISSAKPPLAIPMPSISPNLALEYHRKRLFLAIRVLSQLGRENNDVMDVSGFAFSKWTELMLYYPDKKDLTPLTRLGWKEGSAGDPEKLTGCLAFTKKLPAELKKKAGVYEWKCTLYEMPEGLNESELFNCVAHSQIFYVGQTNDLHDRWKQGRKADGYGPGFKDYIFGVHGNIRLGRGLYSAIFSVRYAEVVDPRTSENLLLSTYDYIANKQENGRERVKWALLELGFGPKISNDAIEHLLKVLKSPAIADKLCKELSKEELERAWNIDH